MKMNMKKKTLLAAALMAISSSSFAATNGAAGSSDILFTAVDINAGTSYTFDLNLAAGLNYLAGADTATSAGTNRPAPNYIVPGTNVPSNGIIYSGALSGFSSFLTDVGGSAPVSLSNVTWNLQAGDTNARFRDLFTSTSSQSGSSNTVKNDTNFFNTYASNVLVTQGGSVVTHLADGTASGLYLNSFTQFPNTFSAMGSSANLMQAAQLTTGSSSTDTAWFGNMMTAAGQQVTVSTFLDPTIAGQWDLQIAAVPERDTDAMLMAGLGLIGFVARRRMQA